MLLHSSLVFTCVAWLDGEKLYLDVSSSHAFQNASALIALNYESLLDPNQRVLLDEGLFWSDNVPSKSRSDFKAVNQLAKLIQNTLEPVTIDRVQYILQINDLKLLIHKPVLISDYIFCLKDEECLVPSSRNIHGTWSIFSPSENKKNGWKKLLSYFFPKDCFSAKKNPFMKKSVRGYGIWGLFFKPIYYYIRGEVASTNLTSHSTLVNPFQVYFPMSNENKLFGTFAVINLCGAPLPTIFQNPKSRTKAEYVTSTYCDQKSMSIFYHDY
ncbi:hypothetical protein DSO57_1020458 [Entomophthora muscae]|uniref:Uncharacterized protein n=1 Tax=Entomophthora muscae TaxID=34485 RepID=A0ACC2T3U0_9FUNG|nr:hypothetical protein DSO57_1020458 [Entomophthora muscae]